MTDSFIISLTQEKQEPVGEAPNILLKNKQEGAKWE